MRLPVGWDDLLLSKFCSVLRSLSFFNFYTSFLTARIYLQASLIFILSVFTSAVAREAKIFPNFIKLTISFINRKPLYVSQIAID